MNPQFHVYPGLGVYAQQNLSYSQAVRVDNKIEISGQGGWDTSSPGYVGISEDANAQVDKAFENIDYTLKFAGGQGWSQVYKVVTYTTDINATHQRIIDNYRKWMSKHTPIWTEVGVAKLGDPKMVIEIEVVAYDPEGAKAVEKA